MRTSGEAQVEIEGYQGRIAQLESALHAAGDHGAAASALKEQLSQGMRAYQALQEEAAALKAGRADLDEQLKRHLMMAAEQKLAFEFEQAKLKTRADELESANRKMEKKLAKAKEKVQACSNWSFFTKFIFPSESLTSCFSHHRSNR